MNAHGVPTVRKPKLRPEIALVLDKFPVLCIRNLAGGDLKRLQQDLMPWGLVVESKSIAGMSNAGNATFEFAPFECRRAGPNPEAFCLFRTKRHRPECMLNIGDDQLLMLLLMIQPK